MLKETILKLWYSGLNKYQIAEKEYTFLKNQNKFALSKDLKKQALKNVEEILINEWLNLSKKN